jgi:hypothetical protein
MNRAIENLEEHPKTWVVLKLWILVGVDALMVARGYPIRKETPSEEFK